MTISRNLGERELPLYFLADSVLERNRFVKLTKTTGKIAYGSYGDTVEGVLRSRTRSEESGINEGTVMPLAYVNSTFFISLAGAVTLGSPVFCTLDGKGKTFEHTVSNMNLAAAPTPGADIKYIVPAAQWGGSHGGALAIYTHVGTSWAYIELADAIGLVVLDSYSGKYYICDGVTWKQTKVLCYAGRASYAGTDVACYISRGQRIVREDLDAGISSKSVIIAAGFTVAAADATGTIVVTNTDIKATDAAVVTLKVAANAVYLMRAICTAGTLTITLSGAGGAGTSVNYQITRDAS